MKKIICFAALLGFINHAFAQNVFPTAAGTSVGIGTGNPTTGKLVINIAAAAPTSAIDIRNSVSGANYNPAITWYSGIYGFIDVNPNSAQGMRYSALGPLVFGSNTNAAYGTSTFAEAMRIAASGNVGIGNTAPGSALHVGPGSTVSFYNGAGTVTPAQIVNLQTSGAAMIGAGVNDGTNNYRVNMFADNTNALTGVAVVGSSGNPGFVIRNTSTEYLRILGTGNLGIGTITPGLKTHINGVTGFPATTGTVQTGVLRLQGTTSNSVLDLGVNGASGSYLQATSQNALNTNYPLLLNPNGGNVGIGILNPTDKLAVNGTIHTKEVRVDLTGWADYVFKKDYKLLTLTEVKDYIDQNHHLPDMPSEKEVLANGLNLGEMNKILTKKVEELTLYLIEKDKENNEQKLKNEVMEIRLQKLEKLLTK